ncbi:hypothetical protein BJ165DRAFT_1597308 [Panaeolus papilionaceus]|nr:hypothetical protein BJ165DRAFT_1597308 [Panaeolus papilionaceus]
MNTASILKPTDKSALKRAENRDPNLRRCLIENCSKAQGVQMVHVLERDASLTSHIINGLEWYWRMEQGTLNLDTRSNIFFVGASLHQLYVDKKWVLLPEREVVFQYFDDTRHRFPVLRSDFRHVEGDTFRYILVPMQDMQDIYISRQSMEENNSTEGITIHEYPFEDFPIVTSHIHPKYAILHAGRTLRKGNLGVQQKSALKERFPWLQQVERLYLAWTAFLPLDAEKDSIFNPGAPTIPVPSHSVPDNTPLHRIQPLFPSNAPEAEQRGCPTVQPAVRASTHRKRPPDIAIDSPQSKKRRLLTSEVENPDMEMLEWTSDQVLHWVKQCSSHSSGPAFIPTPFGTVTVPSPSAPPPSITKPVLRRSERLKAKLRKS